MTKDTKNNSKSKGIGARCSYCHKFLLPILDSDDWRPHVYTGKYGTVVITGDYRNNSNNCPECGRKLS